MGRETRIFELPTFSREDFRKAYSLRANEKLKRLRLNERADKEDGEVEEANVRVNEVSEFESGWHHFSFDATQPTTMDFKLTASTASKDDDEASSASLNNKLDKILRECIAGAISVHIKTLDKELEKMEYNVYDWLIIDRRTKEVIKDGRIVVSDECNIGNEALVLLEAGIASEDAEFMQVSVSLVCSFYSIEEDED